MTLSLQAKAKVLALRIERERRERIRSVPCRSERLTVDPKDLRDLMGADEVRDDSTHSATVWLGQALGIAPEGPQTVLAHRQDEAYLIRDGKRRKATTYTDRPFPSGRPRNKARRFIVGVGQLQAMLNLRGGLPEAMPEHGFNPAPYRDTLAHGRSTQTMKLRRLGIWADAYSQGYDA